MGSGDQLQYQQFGTEELLRLEEPDKRARSLDDTCSGTFLRDGFRVRSQHIRRAYMFRRSDGAPVMRHFSWGPS